MNKHKSAISYGPCQSFKWEKSFSVTHRQFRNHIKKKEKKSIHAETLTQTWNKAHSDVHLSDGDAKCRADGSQADEEASHHHHWTMAKTVAQQCGQWGWRHESATVNTKAMRYESFKNDDVLLFWVGLFIIALCSAVTG